MRLYLAALSLFATALSGHAQQPIVAIPITEPVTAAESVCLIDATTGQVIYEKNADQKRAVASTQKLMTAILVAEAGNLDEKIAVKHTDGQVPPRNIWITQGSYYTRKKLLEVMLVRSYNDVTKCLARDHSGSSDQFATAMRAKATALGMTNSHFLNPHGLTVEGQYSTARDMAVLARVAWANPTIRQFVGTKQTTFTYHGGKTVKVDNSNELLKRYPECVGMKTGYTQAAGRCLVGAATRGNKTVIAVLLGSTEEAIWDDAESALRWGLDR
ncbi:MAG: D-alanyl-D-alanine carboxypeptidase [Verrucomicrobiales bacterium]|nr:D-alanyl-D-alanine carboxypeptidase [Verrucomicrobiales bacterium]